MLTAYRWSEIMSDLVRQSQLRHLGRYSAVVIHESDDAGVQGPLGGLVHAAYGFGVGLVLLADTTGRTRRGRDPGEPESAAGEVPVDKKTRNGVWTDGVYKEADARIISACHSPVGEHVS